MIPNLSTVDDPRAFYMEARTQSYCAYCGYLKRTQISKQFEAHHVLEQRHCKVEGFPKHSPDNSLRLCAKSHGTCHERHTSGMQKIHLGCLFDRNIYFVVRWLGAGAAYNYFRRYYDGVDPRVESLLTLPRKYNGLAWYD